MLRQVALVLVAAVALTPAAAAGRHGHAQPSQRVVVRTELVSASHGFDWLDAAAGFGAAVALAAVVLLVAGPGFTTN